MLRSTFRSTLGAILVLLLVSPVANASTLFAGVDGSATSNCGTLATPCTLDRANEVAISGDVVNVATGIYTGEHQFSTPGVTWVSTPRHGAVLAGEPANGDHVQITGEDVTLDGFQVTGGRVAVSLRASGTKFLNGYVHHVWQSLIPPPSAGAAIDVYNDGNTAMSGVLIAGNHIEKIGVQVGSNQTLQGIYLSVPCAGCRVENNLITDVTDYGIHGNHNACYWTIANNTVLRSGRGILSGPGFLTQNNISAGNGNTFATDRKSVV